MAFRGTLAAAGALAAAIAFVSSPASAAELTPSEQRLARAQVELDATAADLARARTRAQGATKGERIARTREQQVLLARKRALTRRVQGLAARAVETAPTELDVWVVFDTPIGAETGEASPVASGEEEIVADGVQILSEVDNAQPPTGAPVTADALDSYLAGRTSPLAGLGATFVAEASAVGLDPRLLVAIAGAETSFGTYAPSQAIRNPFGLGPGRSYASWADSIRTAARTLAGPIYLGDGRVTISAIQQRWAPSAASNDPTGLNLHWTRNVGQYYRELGADPDGAVFHDAAAPIVPADPTTDLPVGSPGEQLAAAAVGRLGESAFTTASGTGLTPEGLAREAAEQAGIALDSGVAITEAGTPIEVGSQMVGDLLLIGRPGTGDTHLGIYLGAGAFVHASPERGSVTLASVREARFSDGLFGVRRLSSTTAP